MDLSVSNPQWTPGPELPMKELREFAMVTSPNKNGVVVIGGRYDKVFKEFNYIGLPSCKFFTITTCFEFKNPPYLNFNIFIFKYFLFLIYDDPTFSGTALFLYLAS